MSDRFSEEFLTAIGNYTTHLMRWLQCRDWEVKLLDEPPMDGEAAAEVECKYGKKLAKLKLSWDYFSFTPDNQRHFLIHEFCHIVNDPTLKAVQYGGLDTLMGMPAYTAFREAYWERMEIVNDTWASIVGSLLEDDEDDRELFAAVIAAEQLSIEQTEPKEGSDA